MALQASSPFAAFDVTAGANAVDISSVLEDAIYYDTNFLAGIDVAFGDPVQDIEHKWNEEALNSDTVTLGASAASDDTALTLTTNHGARIHIGDQLYATSVINSTETLEVTATSASAATAVRGLNSVTAVSLVNGATLGIIRTEQEGSDIDTDRTLNPTARANYTHIFAGFDLKISGSQLARKMATTAYKDFLARQLAARAIELKINMTRGFLYSEKSASAGSDTVYRRMGGMRYWARTAGITNASSEAISLAVLNLHNKSAVDLGVMNDRLAVGTDLVSTISAFDSTVRRLRESDTEVGYVVQDILLAQGNMVQVLADPRVKTGDAFMFSRSKFTAKPLDGRGMFVIAATDFADAKKRRVLGEWTVEARNPEAYVYLKNKT